MSDEHFTVPAEDLRALFDMAVGSMNFGSGFLDSDEVDVLRRVAVLIGVDPMEATPTEFALRIAHPFVEDWRGGPCKRCRRSFDQHPAADEVRTP